MDLFTEIGFNRELIALFKRAKEKILRNQRIYVVTHNDIDGLASAGSLYYLLKRLGKTFSLVPRGMLSSGVLGELEEDIRSRETSLVIFADLGSFFLSEIALLNCETIILDHHEMNGVPNDLITHINPLVWGESGLQNCCGAVLTYLLYIQFFPEDLSTCLPILLGGVLGDKQDYSPTESNLLLFNYLVSQGHLKRVPTPMLKKGKLMDLLARSLYPFFPSFLFSEWRAKRKLERLGLDPHKCFGDLSPTEREVFDSLLGELFGSFRKEVRDLEYRDKFYLPTQDLPAENLLDLFRVFENSKFSKDIFLDLNPESPKNVSKIRRYYSQLIPLLRYIFNNTKIVHREHFSYAIISKGPMHIIGELFHKYLQNKSKIFFLFKVNNSRIKYSSRSDRSLVDRGLNLSEACSQLGSSFGGQGGGHRIAAGGMTFDSTLDQNIEFLDNFFLASSAIINPLSP